MRRRDQKLVAATFKHEESRNLDPQLHTHCVLVNMVKGQDEKWRTMENRSIFENKMLIGAVYHNALAANLKELGYEIEPTGKNDTFELKGLYSREQLEGFSPGLQIYGRRCGHEARQRPGAGRKGGVADTRGQG